MQRLVHVVTAGLRPNASPSAIEQAIGLAGGLEGAAGARATVIAASQRHLIVATWLSGREQLEPFAASEEHMAFIMQGVATVTDGVWSAAVETDAEPPDSVSELWAFALPDRDEVYEWQVRALIERVEGLPGVASCGLTFEERDRFRAAGVVALRAAERDAFDEALPAVDGSGDWDLLVTARAPVATGAAARR